MKKQNQGALCKDAKHLLIRNKTCQYKIPELKKCPFCGGNAHYNADLNEIFCLECFLTGPKSHYRRRHPSGLTLEEMISAWDGLPRASNDKSCKSINVILAERIEMLEREANWLAKQCSLKTLWCGMRITKERWREEARKAIRRTYYG